MPIIIFKTYLTWQINENTYVIDDDIVVTKVFITWWLSGLVSVTSKLIIEILLTSVYKYYRYHCVFDSQLSGSLPNQQSFTLSYTHYY